MKKILIFLFVLFSFPVVSVNAETQTLNVEFTFAAQDDPTKSVMGYKLYKEGIATCVTNNPAATSLTCEVNSEVGTYNFTLTTLYSDDTESPHSPPFPFTIDASTTAPPPVVNTKMYNLNVEFSFADQTDPTKSVIGYKLYQEGAQACTKLDRTATTLNCDINSVAGTFDFTLTALYSDDSESPHSPPFSYTLGSIVDTPPLEAVISPESTRGEIPYLVYFNADNSTGEITQWDWDFGDGTIGEGRVSGHTYTVPGNYLVKLIVTDSSNNTHQSSITINALEGTPPPEPPTAIISTSTAAGPAPLTVTFDATKSTTLSGLTTSYLWDFGDGSVASGETTRYTYNTAGTYYPRLTVTDSAGEDSVNTPIIVSSTAPANEKPVAKFHATPPVGNSPLKVTFDAADSSDPDGSITEYQWNFGDGASAVGHQVQHAYTIPGKFNASLTVKDDKGGVATASKEILCTPESPINIEVGQVLVKEEWVPVHFNNEFTDPVVIAGLPTLNDGQPTAMVRIREIDTEGFSMRLQEWDSEDDIRDQLETISYMVIEKGIYTLDDGTKIEAGSFTSSTSFEQIFLNQSYNATPVILTQVISQNESDAVAGRLDNINLNSFDFKLQEMESTKRAQASEEIGYIAWEPGSGSISGGLQYEIDRTPNIVTHNWHKLSYQTDFSEQIPMFIAGIQTYAGSDTSTVGIQNLSPTATEIKVEEELSKDAEIRHKAESVGYLLIGGGTN